MRPAVCSSIGRKRKSCDRATRAQALIPSSNTASILPSSMPASRERSPGVPARWSDPPQDSMSRSEKPSVASTSSTTKRVVSVSRPRTETRSGYRRARMAASESSPVRAATANPIRSQDGNVAMVRRASGFAKGPTPRTAMAKNADGLKKLRSASPLATANGLRAVSVAKVRLGRSGLGSRASNATWMSPKGNSVPERSYHIPTAIWYSASDRMMLAGGFACGSRTLQPPVSRKQPSAFGSSQGARGGCCAGAWWKRTESPVPQPRLSWD
jgi:hypothetical protein